MTKYTLYADTHIGSPIEVLRKAVMSEPFDKNTLFLGDIVDLSNCPKDEVPFYKALYDLLKGRHKENYIAGNHSRITIVNQLILRDGVVFAHADMEANPEKWGEYRSKPHGASKFKRKFIIPFIREAEEIINRKPKKEFLDRAASLAKLHGKHTYCGAHFHPKGTISLIHEGIRIVIVPRGRTVIEL